eukprot:1282368-Pleurochrysis_carterae.AAC.1
MKYKCTGSCSSSQTIPSHAIEIYIVYPKRLQTFDELNDGFTPEIVAPVAAERYAGRDGITSSARSLRCAAMR